MHSRRATPQCPRLLTCAAALVAALLPVSALAVFPPYYPDEELVNFPVIVVARWDRGVVSNQSVMEGDHTRRSELHLSLDVTRVIKGNIEPGKHTVIMTTQLTWGRDGRGLETRFSAWVPPDVDNIATDNLWMLSRQRSCRKDDPTEYLCWKSLRAVQPLALEPYFQALNRGTFNAEAPALLAANNRALAIRTLAYIAGGVLPSRSATLTQQWKKRSHKPLAVHADAVAKLLTRPEADIRRAAALVYAQLAAREAVPRTRLLLHDPDPVVRLVAADVLAEHRDDVSLDAIAHTVQDTERTLLGCRIVRAAFDRVPGLHTVQIATSGAGGTGSSLAAGALPEAAGIEATRIALAYRTCDLVARLAAWGNDRLVPALIALLQNETLARKAQAALKEVTGYTFPLDAPKCQNAWAQAIKIAHPAERRAFLAKALPYDPEPLAARLVAADGAHTIVVTNTSKAPVALATSPSCIDFRGDSGVANGIAIGQDAEGTFVDLAPGEATRVPIRPPDIFARSAPASRKMVLHYTRNGAELGLSAWIGDLAVAIGQGVAPPPSHEK